MSSSLLALGIVAGGAAGLIVLGLLLRSRARPRISRNSQAAPQSRLSYEESCRKLQALGLIPEGEFPPLPSGVPQSGDEILGVSFFRTEVSDAALENLSLPRTFIGRSLVEKSSFRGTDLSESNLCWNDFVEVDFSRASLRSADLRASQFSQVNFSSCDLSKADLRQSSFDDCVFGEASFVGAKLTRAGSESLALEPEQLVSIDWQATEGAEPDGG